MTFVLAQVSGDPVGSTTVGFFDYIRVLLIFAAIALMAYVTARHWLPKALRLQQPQSGDLAVLARYSLEPRRTLWVVKAGTAVMLVGTSEAGMQLLSALDPKDFPSSEASGAQASGAPDSSLFSKIFKSKQNP